MNEANSTATASQLSERVRQNIGSALVAAALLCYFGFVSLAEPTGTDLFSRAAYVFYHTLRFGGVAMAIVAVGSIVGLPVFLLVDGVVSVAIGTLLVMTGLAMLYDGGGVMQVAINIVCGGMFFSAGRHNWADYFTLSRAANRETTGPVSSDRFTAPFESNEASMEKNAPVSLRRVAGNLAADASEPTAAPLSVPVLDTENTSPSPPQAPDDLPVSVDKKTPDGGFLASFGQDGSPPTA